MRSYGFYQEAELEAALGADRLRAQEVRRLVDRAVRSSVNGVVITDARMPDNPIVYVNPGFEQMTGYLAEEAVGQNCRFLQNEDRDQPELEELREAIQEGRECQVVLRNYKKDGTLFWNELSVSPVYDEEGSLANFVGVQNDVTERKRVEEALQYQLDLVRTITNNAADSLFLWDAEGRVTFMNPAAEQTFGWKQEELLGEALHESLHHHYPDGRPYPMSECPLVRAFESGQTLHYYEDLFFRKDGAPIDVACSFAPIVVNGKITGAVLVVRDITERKRAEEALKQSERLYRTVIEQAKENIFLVEVETRRIVESNPTFQETLGYTEEELKGMTLYDIVVDARKSVDVNIRRILEQKNPFVGERKYRRKDGSLVDVEVSASTVLRNGRETLCVVAHDVTERKRSEEALRRSEALHFAVVDAAFDAIVTMTADGLIRSFNQGAERIFGFTAEEAIGQPLTLLMPERFGELHRAGLRRYLKTGKARAVGRRMLDLVGRRKDGEEFPLELAITEIREGEDLLFTGIIRDITERKRAEEAQRFLSEAGASLSSSLDYRTTLASVAHLAVPYLADWCVVDILEEDGSLDRLALTHQDPEKIALAQELEERYPPDPEAQRGVTQVLRTGRSELLSEIPESALDEAARDAEHRRILRELGLKSYMVVPLVARGRTLGAITLVSAESGRRYGAAELGLAEELARRAAFAVDNARLYQGRSEIARTLQGSLLPSRLPEVPGVEVGLRYLPVGEVDVGGDFYDLFDARVNGEADPSEPSSSWGVVIGDVCGKGAGAAAMLALARHTIRTVAMRETRSSAILAGLNEAMLRQRRERDEHKFCTIVYARLETGGGDAEHGAKITVSCGGHSPPVRLEADGSIRKIGCSGRALGVFEDANLTEQEVRLAPGDALVLYTDGVVEARAPDGAFFGEERLMALLRSCVGLDASNIAGRIESAVLEFQENNPRDDVAVLVLRVPA